MRQGETIADLLALAGGFAAEAIEDSVLLKRVASGGEVTMRNVTKEQLDMPLRDKDDIGVYDGLKDRGYVTVSGATMRTGQFELARGEMLSNLIVRAGGFKPSADLTAAYLARRGGSVMKLDLKDYLSPEPSKDLPLENGDELTIPHIAKKITIGGEVNEPESSRTAAISASCSTSGWRGAPRRTGAWIASRSIRRMEACAKPDGTRASTAGTSSW